MQLVICGECLIEGIIVSLVTVRPLEYSCSPCTAVIQHSSTSHGSVVSLVLCYWRTSLQK